MKKTAKFILDWEYQKTMSRDSVDDLLIQSLKSSEYYVDTHVTDFIQNPLPPDKLLLRSFELFEELVLLCSNKKILNYYIPGLHIALKSTKRIVFWDSKYNVARLMDLTPPSIYIRKCDMIHESEKYLSPVDLNISMPLSGYLKSIYYCQPGQLFDGKEWHKTYTEFWRGINIEYYENRFVKLNKLPSELEPNV